MNKKHSNIFKDILYILKETITRFIKDNAIYYSAALSYFTIFSLPPIIIIIVYITANIFGNKSIGENIYQQFDELLGHNSSEQIKMMVEHVQNQPTSAFSKTIAIGALLIASTGTFIAIQSTLNKIWKVRPLPKNNIVKIIKDRLLSFTLVLGIAFLLLVSLVLHAILITFTRLIQEPFDDIFISTMQYVNFIIPLIIITILFGMIYKILPDAKIKWKDVLIGSLVTASLFTLGKYVIGLYLGSSSISSAYGAAGTVVLILVWVFYSSCLLFMGAEFTHVYAERFGSGIHPSEYAVKVEEKIKPHKGNPSNED